jgi:hypothetical protein
VERHQDLKEEQHLRLKAQIAQKLICPLATKLPEVSFANAHEKKYYMEQLKINPNIVPPPPREIPPGERPYSQFPIYNARAGVRSGFLMLNGDVRLLPASITDRLYEEPWDPRRGTTIKYQKKLYNEAEDLKKGRAAPLTKREKELLASYPDLRSAIKADGYVYRILDVAILDKGLMSLNEQCIKQGDRVAVCFKMVPHAGVNGFGVVAWMDLVMHAAQPGSLSRRTTDTTRYLTSLGILKDSKVEYLDYKEGMDIRGVPKVENERSSGLDEFLTHDLVPYQDGMGGQGGQVEYT